MGYLYLSFLLLFQVGPHAFSFCIQNILERLQQEIRAFIWGYPID
jgi:hypothetical protein